MDLKKLASELLEAHSTGVMVSAPPSARDAEFKLADAYSVEFEIVRRRLAEGRRVVGLKVGYANRAMWRALKLETLVWAHMYDDTVRYAVDNRSTFSLYRTIAPKIEPEIVFCVKEPLQGGTDPAQILARVEWIALGFEIIDCVFPDWKFQPVDFVAALGLHKALIVGQPQPVAAETIPQIAEQLPSFKLRLMKDGQLVEEGSGRNSLRSPALCLGEVASRTALTARDLVSSGTLTTAAPIARHEEWRAEVEGLDLPALTIRFLD